MSSESTSGSFTYIRGTVLANGSTAPPSTPVDDAAPIHGLANAAGLEAGFAAHSIPSDVNVTNAVGSTTTRPLTADETDNDALWLEVMSFGRKLKVKHDELTAVFALYHRISDHPAEMRVRFLVPPLFPLYSYTNPADRRRRYPGPLHHPLLRPPAGARTRPHRRLSLRLRAHHPNLRRDRSLKHRAQLAFSG